MGGAGTLLGLSNRLYAITIAAGKEHVQWLHAVPR